jgi:hypothetical protein
VERTQVVSRSSKPALPLYSRAPPNTAKVTTTLNASPEQRQPNQTPSPNRLQSLNNRKQVKHPQPAHQPAAVPAPPSRAATTGSAPSPPPTSTNTCKPARSTAPAPRSSVPTPPPVNSRSFRANSCNSSPRPAKRPNSSTASSARRDISTTIASASRSPKQRTRTVRLRGKAMA